MMKKEIWIQVEDGREKKEIEKVILSLIEEDESVAGEFPILLFAKINRVICRLSHIYDMSENAVNVLKERFGDYNVVLKNAREEDEEELYFDYLIKELTKCPGSSAEFKLELMKIGRLDSIVSALDRIDASLEALEPLADCVQKNGFIDYLNISGIIGTHER